MLLNNVGTLVYNVNKGIDFLDENIPSQFTLTGSFKTDPDVLLLASVVLAQEIALAKAALRMLPSYVRAIGV